MYGKSLLEQGNIFVLLLFNFLYWLYERFSQQFRHPENILPSCHRTICHIQFYRLPEIPLIMNAHRFVKLFTRDWSYVIGILCGICVGMNACTKPSTVTTTPPSTAEKKMPPREPSRPDSSMEAETQLFGNCEDR